MSKSRGNLKEIMVFPAEIVEKLNGYLGIVGYHSATDELYISSKSASDGEYAGWIGDLLTEEQKEQIKDYNKTNNTTLVFEVIEPEKDPHIIGYDEAHLVLIGIIYNEVIFREEGYEKVKELAVKLGFKYPRHFGTVNSWTEFMEFYNNAMAEDVHDLTAERIEGFIVTDSKGFKVKIKQPFYNYWKHIRDMAVRHSMSNFDVRSKYSALDTELILYGAEQIYKGELSRRNFDVPKFLKMQHVQYIIEKHKPLNQ